MLLSGATYQRVYGRLHNVNLKNSTLKGLKLPTLKKSGTVFVGYKDAGCNDQTSDNGFCCTPHWVNPHISTLIQHF